MMSSYGAFPAVCDMLDTFACSTPPLVLDVGCGDGSLGPFLKRRGSQLRYVGIEDPRVTRSEPLRASSGPGSTGEESGIARVSLKDYVAGLAQDERCVIVLSFVLHEILGQHGEGPLRELLSGFAQDPRVVGLVIVEVDAAPTNARLQDSASGRGYYNLYFLIHDIYKAAPHASRILGATLRRLWIQVAGGRADFREGRPTALRDCLPLRKGMIGASCR